MSEIHHFSISTPQGLTLAIRRTRSAGASPAAGTRPLLIVPGYGMNSFVFGFHPLGLSLEAHLASRGLEVWSVDLRGQGSSSSAPHPDYGLGDLAVEDLGAAIDFVCTNTTLGDGPVDLVGCSLGASICFAHLACVPGAKVRAVVNMGGMVTWRKTHPLVQVAFASPWLVGKVKFSGTRSIARLALPLIARTLPKLLSIYLNPETTDLARADTMVNTVEDPVPSINREIAKWLRSRELSVRGVNVSRALRTMKNPLLCIVANQDGIVPPETARAVYDEIGSDIRELLSVGSVDWPVAHADLFLGRHAQERIFEPMARFLLALPRG